MGYRDATGWHTVAQAAIPGGVRYNTWYDMLVAVNGTTVTVHARRHELLLLLVRTESHRGESFGLNKGLLGFGSDNSRGKFDNIQLRVLRRV